MPFAIELYFDDLAETAVRQVWDVIAQTSFNSRMIDSGYRPHVSLAVYDNDALEIDRLQQDLTTYAQAISSFNLCLSFVGTFVSDEGVIFLGPTVTQDLLDAHTTFHHLFKGYNKDLRSYYAIGNWIPHCTLAYGLSRKAYVELTSIDWKIPLPLLCHIQEIGLAKVSPSSCEILYCHSVGTGA